MLGGTALLLYRLCVFYSLPSLLIFINPAIDDTHPVVA